MDVHLAVAVLRVAIGRDARRKAERLRPLGETADHGGGDGGSDGGGVRGLLVRLWLDDEQLGLAVLMSPTAKH